MKLLKKYVMQSCHTGGFTLLELLIVIALIGILVTMSVASYSSVQKKSRNARRMADVRSIQQAWEQYYADNNGLYPATCSISTTYLPAGIPTDPKTSVAYTSGATCTTTAYCVCATMEGAIGGNASDTSCTFAANGAYFCVKNLQ